jgi:hypothetical protein
MGLAILLAHSDAHAGECKLATPACHLENGKRLLDSDPKRAAEELLASYKLDERTDTLELYAVALTRDKQYALAVETWQRIIVFRESEVEAAKETERTEKGKKRDAAKAAGAKAQRAMDQAAEELIKLWNNVGKVRVRIPDGQQYVVLRGGVEVDVSRDVPVNAGGDELVFRRKDGSEERVVVQVGAGQNTKLDAPTTRSAKPTPPKPVEPPKPVRIDQPKPVTPDQPTGEDPAKPDSEEPAKPLDQPVGSVTYVAQPRSRTMSLVGIGVAAGGVVLGGLAIGRGVAASTDYDDARDAGCTADGMCPVGRAGDLAERSNDRARLAQISAVGGGLMVAGGAVLWYLGRKKTQRAATDVTFHIAPSSAAFAWRF